MARNVGSIVRMASIKALTTRIAERSEKAHKTFAAGNYKHAARMWMANERDLMALIAKMQPAYEVMATLSDIFGEQK